MMKKLSALSLALILFLCVVGCSKADDKGENPGPTGIGSTNNPQDADTYITENIVVGKGTEYELNGLLTVPSDATADKPWPAVVLVHGSGPSDMDETVYDVNKPFRDIAEYLSSHGIAVTRYDKRTFTHGEKVLQEFGGSLTVYEETIEDAILATEMLKSDPRINSDKVFILGHSMGGSLAPRIYAMGGNYAGLILLAGTPRSLSEVIADQQLLYYKETLEGDELVEILALFESGLVDEQIVTIVNTPDDEAKAKVGENGVSVYYLKDFETNPAEKYIENITVPFLVMQADNDFQVFTDTDFTMYKELLGGRSSVTFKLYEGLNHLFMPSTVTRSIDIHDEYKIKAHVDGQVLADIAEWIKEN